MNSKAKKEDSYCKIKGLSPGIHSCLICWGSFLPSSYSRKEFYTPLALRYLLRQSIYLSSGLKVKVYRDPFFHGNEDIYLNASGSAFTLLLAASLLHGSLLLFEGRLRRLPTNLYEKRHRKEVEISITDVA